MKALTADQVASYRHDGFLSPFNALSPDLKTDNESRLNTFERQWQQFLSEAAVAVNKLFEQWVNNAEQQSLQLDYRAPIETSDSPCRRRIAPTGSCGSRPSR